MRAAALAALFAVAAIAPAQVPDLADGSCQVCHTGPTRGLSMSVHASLLRSSLEHGAGARTCTSCHGDLSAHAAAASDPGNRAPVLVPRVRASSCAECHPGRALATADAAHPLPWNERPLPSPLPEQDRDDAQMQALAAAARQPGLDWSGLVELGYRFVHVAGSRDAYATDVDLEPGARVRSLEVRGTGSDASAVDELSLLAHDLGDPRWDVGLRARKNGSGEVGGEYARDRYYYRSSGEYHRVDRTTKVGRADAEVELGQGVRAFGSLGRHDEEGYWLTQRIGNRNVSVQSYIDGVESPRHAETNDAEFGLTLQTGDWTWTGAASWLDGHTRDRWTYSQPSPVNPAFPESEDFTSRTSTRGPGGRVQVAGDFDGISIDAAARLYDHDQRITGEGTSAGFDVAEFTTDTTALGTGGARTWLADLSLTFDVFSDVQLVFDVHWRDHTEDLSLQQTDVTTQLGSTVTVLTDVDQHTAQRLLEGAAMLEWAASKSLDLGLGYGGSREDLRVPDLGDPNDFVSGTTRDEGLLANLRWRPGADWVVRGDLRDFAQDGAPLHELAPERARTGALSVGVEGEKARGSAFLRHRQNENDVAPNSYHNIAMGATAGADLNGLQCSGTYVFARTSSRTQTNFYFDPDPNPVPTLVGFVGDTHTVSGSLVLSPSGDVRWSLIGAWTHTTGDFEVSTIDWRADVRVQVSGEAAAVGAEFRSAWYHAEGGLDDWDAQSVFVYWRQLF